MTIFSFIGKRRKTDDPVFVDLTNDYGFKIIFGNESNKDVLLALLRQLIPDEDIRTIEHIDKEKRTPEGCEGQHLRRVLQDRRRKAHHHRNAEQITDIPALQECLLFDLRNSGPAEKRYKRL